MLLAKMHILLAINPKNYQTLSKIHLFDSLMWLLTYLHIFNLLCQIKYFHIPSNNYKTQSVYNINFLLLSNTFLHYFLIKA